MKTEKTLNILLDIIPVSDLITNFEIITEKKRIIFEWRGEKYRFREKHNSFDQIINGKPERTNSSILLRALWENKLKER